MRHNRRFPYPIRKLVLTRLGIDLEILHVSYEGCVVDRDVIAHDGTNNHMERTASRTPATHALWAGSTVFGDGRNPHVNEARLRRRLPSILSTGNPPGHRVVRQEVSS